MKHTCEECGKTDFFWHCQEGWGCATCLGCKTPTWFKKNNDGNETLVKEKTHYEIQMRLKGTNNTFESYLQNFNTIEAVKASLVFEENHQKECLKLGLQSSEYEFQICKVFTIVEKTVVSV